LHDPPQKLRNTFHRKLKQTSLYKNKREKTFPAKPLKATLKIERRRNKLSTLQ